ncbi:cell envelope integrity protein TolA [Pelomonas sp. V22]|uniref:cell envelope integrity protein TolA n=1 Tax=Pelomonas sp. V22 TaxID=2822139 RepID=UPI0024A834D8|nr:cell envelope integrity protein TolA [Pelomonas sp. V22]
MQNSTLQMPGLSLRPPQPIAMGRGFAVALVAHALLLLALTLNVQWHSATPEAFEAELWSAVPQAAAPAAVEPEPEPPKPVVEDKPKPQEPSAEELQAQREAEIAIAKAKKRAEEKKEEQRLAEIREKELKAKQLKEKQEREKQLAKEKAEKAEKQEKQDKLDKAKQLEKQQKDKAAKEAEARQENARKDALRRLQGLAGGTGAADATGTAQQSSGPSAGYAGRIKAKIRPNIVFDVGATNPVAEVEVRVAPDGRIISKRLLKPSGDAEWDRAVERAIDKTEILPRDTDGRVPPVIVLSLRPRE